MFKSEKSVKVSDALNYAGVIFGVIGFIFTLFNLIQNFSKSSNQSLQLLLLTFSAVTFLITYYIYLQLKKEVHFEFIPTIKGIIRKIENYSLSDNYILGIYIGEEKSEISTKIVSSIENHKWENFEFIHYGFRKSDSIDKRLFDHEASKNHIFYKYLPHDQICNIFQVKDKNKKPITILFFKDGSGNYSGLEIKKPEFQIDLQQFGQADENSSLNYYGKQDSTIIEISNEILKLWEPLLKGYSKWALPPLDNDDLRKTWHEETIKWHTETITDLVNEGKYRKLKITWNITGKSLEDKEQLITFLDALNDLSRNGRMEVDRYILINCNKYKVDSEYKNVVEKLADFMDKHRNDDYRITYIDSSDFDSSLKNDYAILEGSNNDIIVQSAVMDNYKNKREVLKIYYTKSKSAVDEKNNKFKALSQRIADHTLDKNFSDFSSKIGLNGN